MTRESLPDFDLYAELEVSRHASVEVIEAAYRVLAKRHHPDVSQPDDEGRIKRLNLAHNWLVDPDRRRRYDNATQPPPSRPLQGAAAGVGLGRLDPADELGTSARTASKAFGPNTGEVRTFLAELRALDELRAWQVRDGVANVDADAYAAARHAAFLIGQVERKAEWLLARDAASVIARGKLADAPLQAEITNVLADIAGAIVIRDLILPADFDQLLAPWRWRGDRSAVASAVAGSAVTVATGAAAAGVAGARRVFTSAPVMALVVLVSVVAVAGIWSLLTGSKGPAPAAAVDATGGPTIGAVLPSSVTAPATVDPSSTQLESTSPSASLAPGITAGPTPTGAPGSTLAPSQTPRITPRPTPTPTPKPTPVPTPIPTPTPVPTPSPPVDCLVPNLAGVNTNGAQAAWNLAGFTGTVIFLDPLTKPPWKIASQSLAAGITALCTSGVTVSKFGPSPTP